MKASRREVKAIIARSFVTFPFRSLWRAQYQRALEASERRFQLLIERNADGVVVVRGDGVICYANPAAGLLLRRGARKLGLVRD